MSNSARSLFVFGIYLVVLSLVLLVSPNLLLGTFSLTTTSEVWIRVVGVLALLLGYYYIQAARHNLKQFFPWTVHARGIVILFFTAFVLMNLAGPSLILFGLVDLLGAAWTWQALRSEK